MSAIDTARERLERTKQRWEQNHPDVDDHLGNTDVRIPVETLERLIRQAERAPDPETPRQRNRDDASD